VLVAAFANHQYRLTERSLKFGNFKSDDGIDTPAYLRLYAHDRTLIGERLRACVRPDDFAIFGGVGAMPYAARLRGIDVFRPGPDRIAHEVARGKIAPATTNGVGPLLATYNPTIVMHFLTSAASRAWRRWAALTTGSRSASSG
jgi:hypothetical protein